MSDKINPEAVRDVVASLYDDDIRFYGVYNGRSFFKGIGVTVESDSDLMRLAIALKEAGLDALATGYHHTDSMGFGRVIAWNMRLFDEPTPEQEMEWQEDSEYA